MDVSGFTWQDGERTIVFGRGSAATAPQHLGEEYLLLATARTRELAPELVSAAGATVEVGAGWVEDLAAAVLADLPSGAGGTVVALGGGRVVDTAKAVAAATGRRAAAVPTTLSAAEMTWVHRHARGVAAATPRVRPAVVVNDPALSASQPLPELAASCANALAHAVEGPCTVRASPVPTLAAREAIRLTAAAWADPKAPGRDVLALAALLAGWAIDATWYGISHVCSQTLVRVAGVAHGAANAVVLPHTAAALRRRAPDVLSGHDEAAGRPVEELAAELAGLAHATRLRDLGVPEDRLAPCARTAATRDELALTPPAAGEAELLDLYRAAW